MRRRWISGTESGPWSRLRRLPRPQSRIRAGSFGQPSAPGVKKGTAKLSSCAGCFDNPRYPGSVRLELELLKGPPYA